MINFELPSLARTDGADLMEKIIADIINPKGLNYTNMYEKKGIDYSKYSCIMELTHDNVVNEWSKGKYALINWAAHGSYYAAFRMIWEKDDGDEIPEENEIRHEFFIHKDDTSKLSEEYPGFVFANSCNNGAPDEDSLGKNLIKQGSSGVISSSRIAFYRPGWEKVEDGRVDTLNYIFLEHLLIKNQCIGKALFDGKREYSIKFLWDSYEQQNLFDFNLYGEPSLYRKVTFLLITPTNLKAKILSTNKVELTWEDNSINEEGFEIERRKEGESYKQLATVTANTTLYIDTSVEPDTKYYYRVRAYRGKLTSEYSNEDYAKTISLISRGEVKIIGGENGYINPDRKEEAIISFVAESSGNIKVEIFTLDGYLVKELSKYTFGGQDYIKWDITNEDQEVVASGVYIIIIKGPGLDELKKVVILR
jgi:hypothetical protein